MSFQLIHNSVLHIHRNIGLTGKLEEVKKERNRSCHKLFILFLDMHPKYLYYDDYGFI